jgi:hypothetical protein
MAETKEGVMGALDKADDIATATVNAVSGTMEHTLKGTRALGKELGGLVFETVAGLVLGTAEVGMNADKAAKSIMIGSIRGAHQVGRTSLDTVAGVAASLVKSMSHAGGNLVNAAQGAVEGAITAARDVDSTSRRRRPRRPPERSAGRARSAPKRRRWCARCSPRP